MRSIGGEKVGVIDYTSMEIVRTYYLTNGNRIEIEQTVFYYEDGHREKWYKGLLYHNDSYIIMTTHFDTLTDLEKACRHFFMVFNY